MAAVVPLPQYFTARHLPHDWNAGTDGSWKVPQPAQIDCTVWGGLSSFIRRCALLFRFPIACPPGGFSFSRMQRSGGRLQRANVYCG